MGEENKKVVIKVEIPEDDYKVLSKIAKSSGYSLTVDFIKDAILSLAESGEKNISKREITEYISRRIEKVVQDLLNPFTQKIDSLSSRIAELEEMMESIGGGKEEHQYKHQPERETKPQKRRTALEVLKEQGIIFSESVQWLRSPEAYFKKLEAGGAVVLNIDDEKVAMDREYWERFKAKLETIAIREPKEVEDILVSEFGENASRLFEKLSKKGLVYYDDDLNFWLVSEEINR
ncbi:MAG: hypothetical protein F7B61_05540 [Caldisphaeraceae archaeon]|nr:hypothetical protein [Caldisphaeraceae archaeon]